MHLLFSAIMLTALVFFGRVSADAAQQQAGTAGDTAWTIDKPLTGRAISCENGKILIFDCQNVELLAYLPRSAVQGAAGYDIWGWIDSTTGREFVISGGPDGVAFVEVTDPVNPKYLGKLPLHEGASGGIPGIKVYKNHAFIVAEAINNGMQVFDLTQLRDVKNPPVDFQETAHYDKFFNAHTLTMDEATGFAYPVGSMLGGETCGGGLHMVDVRTPTKPTFAGCFTNGKADGNALGASYIHDTQCVVYHGPDKQYQNQEICFNSAGGAVVIADVTDKNQPKIVSVATYPNTGFTHQGWLTEDQRYFFLDDETDDGAGGIHKTRTIVFDMNDLDDPVVLTEFYGSTDATDHNLYIRGQYMYQSNYTAGLRIIDIADPKNPKEVGYLDTAPDLSGPGMILGSWGNYPYFKNDVVAVSSKGIFLVRLRSR